MSVTPASSSQPADSEFQDFDARPPLPGFRLDKFEVYNWGTFDGVVHAAQPRGQTTLLIGENGSGKSTLVDALLTLLVRPQTRNYNVAAGAAKNERDERTYIRGAYDRTVGEAGRPQVQYLRTGRGQYSALLATFANAQSGKVFTVCQVLYLDADSGVEKVYGFCDQERGIVSHLGDLNSGSSIARQMRERGFRTTSSYKEYFEWLRKATGFRPKAMDVFNQTVAVKDVQRLDSFIRNHMLEPKSWSDRVGQLLRHFNELSEAHRMLVRVRQQEELLRPVAHEGERYLARRQDVLAARRQLDAAGLFFAQEQVRLLEPLCAGWEAQMATHTAEVERLGQLLERLNQDLARLEMEVEQAGGERLRQLPARIEQAAQLVAIKSAARRQFDSQLAQAGIQKAVTSPAQFQKLHAALARRRIELAAERARQLAEYNAIQFEIGRLTSRLAEEQGELAALEHARGNLPESLMEIRRRVCQTLKLPVGALPFAAELIAVKPGERRWEAAIEQVLSGLARSLLVPAEHYARVAEYVDQQRLVDARGAGQRLVYLRVEPLPAAQSQPSGSKRSSGASPAGAGSGRSAGQARPQGSGRGSPWDGSGELDTDARLVDKLDFHPRHALGPWVRNELEQRFNYLACETVEEFRRATGPAMTVNRHVKSGHARHEKDDRRAPDDRRHYVLGWDNQAKRAALLDALRQTGQELDAARLRADDRMAALQHIAAAEAALEQASSVREFESIDAARHEFELSQLRVEKQRLEDADDTVRQLRKSAAQLRSEATGYSSDRDGHIASRARCEHQYASGKVLLENSRRVLQAAIAAGEWQAAEAEFAGVGQSLSEPLTLENIGSLPDRVERLLRQRHDTLLERLRPAERELTAAMTRFLKRFPDEQHDLDAAVESLPSFLALLERIASDDLPQHEQRFKKRLNEKVLHELGLLYGSLETERQEIRDKIEQLNGALRMLQWKPGTYMQLETNEATDREILDFRRELAACLSGSFDAEPEASEATFARIERFVEKLRDAGSERWRDKVIDVRNWFGFAARELVAATGEVRSYYDGGTGQSGGEKGKLAFLVLAAAIAFQYDLQPDADDSDRFHFVMVDEMFSRSDDQHAEYALELFERFRLQLLIVAPLDAKARVTQPYVGTYLHVVKNQQTSRSELLTLSAEQLREPT
jgi:uncharacterized protein YPO0396